MKNGLVQADIGLHLLLHGIGDEHPGLGDLEIVHRLEAVEQVDSGTDAVVVVERRRVEIGVRLRVDAAAEVIVSIGLRRYLRRKQLQCRIPPVDPCVADRRLLDPHLRGIGHGVGHAVMQGHRSLRLGACHPDERQSDNYTLKEKGFHVYYV